MEQKCNEKAKEYTEQNDLHDDHVVDISWYPIANTNYKIGIVDRVQTEDRKSTGKKFVFLNEEKKKEIDAIEQKIKEEQRSKIIDIIGYKK